MKKVPTIIAALILVVWIASWFRVPDAVVKSAARPWPGGKSTLEQPTAQPKPVQTSAAALKLMTLAQALPAKEVIDGFVSREIARPELGFGQPRTLPDVTPIRDLLLRDSVTWQREEGIGGGKEQQEQRAAQMIAARALVADAFAKARANDAAAWDDLHAVWILARSLDGQPQLNEQTAALSMLRMVNAAAWKMPLPPPAWLAEVQQRDGVPPLLEAFRYQTSSYAKDQLHVFPTKFFADSLDRDRSIAVQLAKETRCDIDPRENEIGVDLRSVWRRAFRYRAEREATANALRIREGKPIETASRCSDGTWSFDGTTLRFSRPIALGDNDKAMPLALRVR